MPTIRTKRLVLIPYTSENVTQEHVDWLNDPEVVRYSEQRHIRHTEVTQQIYVGWARLNGDIWIIQKDGVDIGTISMRIDKDNKTANMGILIGRKGVWGQGYASEAWKAVMHYCFAIGLRKVECGTMCSNAGMRGVALKTGMFLEGSRPKHFLLDGEPEDLILYGRQAQ